MDSSADLDSDGASNYEEWIADTIPTNSLSRLHIMNTSSSNLVFTSSSNREYQVLFSTNLLDEQWLEETEWFDGESPETTKDVSKDDVMRFHRIRVRIPSE